MKKINRRKFVYTGLYVTFAAALFQTGWNFSTSATAQESFIPFILHIHASGGWDTTMVFENKIGQQFVSQEPGAATATGAGNIPYIDHANRPSVKTFFDKYGANAAIVNGINAGGIDRLHAIKNVMGAIPPNKTRYADWLSFFAYSTNPVMALPHVVIDAPWLPGDYAPIAVRLTSKAITEYGSAKEGDLGVDGETALTAFRANTYSQFFTRANDKSLDGDKLKALFYSYSRDGNVYSEIAKSMATLGDTSGDTNFLKNGKIAVELFAQGSSQAVTLQSGPDNEWDTTVDNFSAQAEKFEALFSGINDILTYATARGVASKMLIIVTSERGRAPLLNSSGGKNAWPFTSALLWGAGINGGTVTGLTDPALRGLPIDPIFGGQTTAGSPLEMGHIMSAIYLKTNVPTKLLLPNHKPLSPILLAEDL